MVALARPRSSNSHEYRLDATNRKIIDLLVKNPGMSQTDLAAKIGISQSAIALRLEKLRKSELITNTTGIKLEKLGLKMARVDLSTSSANSVMNWARKCPLFVNASLGIGGENLSLYILSEDIEMFQYIVEHHLRRLKGVNKLEFTTILSWMRDQNLPILLDVEKSRAPPCGVYPYCPRCPANPSYDGEIWVNGESKERNGRNSINNGGSRKNAAIQSF